MEWSDSTGVSIISLVDTCANLRDTIWVNGVVTVSNHVFADSGCMKVVASRGRDVYHFDTTITAGDTIFWRSGPFKYDTIIKPPDTLIVKSRVNIPDTIRWVDTCTAGVGCSMVVADEDFVWSTPCDSVVMKPAFGVRIFWSHGDPIGGPDGGIDTLLFMSDSVGVIPFTFQIGTNRYNSIVDTADSTNKWFQPINLGSTSIARSYPIGEPFWIHEMAWNSGKSGTSLGGNYHYPSFRGRSSVTGAIRGDALMLRWITDDALSATLGSSISFYAAEVGGGTQPTTMEWMGKIYLDDSATHSWSAVGTSNVIITVTVLAKVMAR